VITMSALVVYESSFGNTQAVATAVADGIAQHLPVRVVSVAEPTSQASDDETLVIVGGPTHAFSMSREGTRREAQERGGHSPGVEAGLRDWIARLSADRTDRLYATFDTRVAKVRHLPGSAARAAARALHRSGHHAVGEPESFYVADVEGPLLPDELGRARDWGAALAKAATSTRTAT
jgi:hypothetical protein